MKLKIETRYAAEKLGSRINWALLALVGVLLGEHLGNAVTAVVFGALLLFCAATSFSVQSEDRFARYHLVPSFLRFLQALACAGTLLKPEIASSSVWIASLGFLIIEGFATCEVVRTSIAAGAVSVLALQPALSAAQPSWHSFVPGLFIAACAPIGLLIATFKDRGDELQASNQRLDSLLECGSELAASCDLRSTIMHTLKSAVHQTNATCGYVMLIDDQKKDLLVTEAAYGVDGEFDFPQTTFVGAGISGYVAKLGQAIAVTGSSTKTQDFDGMTATVRSAASVPLVIRGYSGGGQAAVDQVLGVMTLIDLNHPTSFGKEDMELLRSLGSLISVAVSNARMEERRRTTFLLTLESLATALEARDEYTRGHSQRVCEVSLLIGEKLGLGPEAIEELRVGTILHDIGKIGVPDAILNKRARLTDEEFTVMKSHPVIGYEICRPLMLSEGVLMIIRNHHEKLDGSGYPDGLKGGELPLSLRIVCAADAFDAMSSKRPYRSVMDTGAVLAELSRGAGSQFDPVVVESLKELMLTERLQDLYRQYWGDGEEVKAA